MPNEEPKDSDAIPVVGDEFSDRADRASANEKPDLEAIAEATSRRMRSAPLSREQMAEVMRAHKPIAIGIMGWCTKVGEVRNAKTQKVTPGMRVSGQIVSTFGVHGRFGMQQAVVIAGTYSCPKHANANGEVVDAVENVEGRWMLGIDSALTELPACVGDVVDVELLTRGGGGKRHTYKRVNAWSVDDIAG